MSNAAEESASEEERRYIAELQRKLEKARQDKFTFLLIGRTGVGKSSTINTLLGKEVAPVGAWKPTTISVKTYEGEVFGVSFKVVDTPGLCDELEEEGNDEKYLKLIGKHISAVDCMWFVTRLDETRVSSDEKRGIKLITDAFGKEVWKNSVIVFTFANTRRPEFTYREIFRNRQNLIQEEIEKRTSAAIAAKVPAVAVDNKSEMGPDGKPWLGELYTTSLERMSKDGSVPFILATIERVVAPSTSRSSYYPSASSSSVPIKLDKEQAERVSRKVNASIIPGTALAGAAIGSVLGPVGAAVGGAIGAVVGWLTWRKHKA